MPQPYRTAELVMHRLLDLDRSAAFSGLGATLLTREPVTEDGWSWHILADPDGNEFCVLQPPGMPAA